MTIRRCFIEGKGIPYGSMIEIKRRMPPRKRRILPGYVQKVAVQRAFEPVEMRFKITAKTIEDLEPVPGQIQMLVSLKEEWRREEDARAIQLYGRMQAIREHWTENGVRVRRTIFGL